MTFKQAMVKHAQSLWRDSYSFKQQVLADFKQHFDRDGERGVQRAAKVWQGTDSHKKGEFFPRTYA
jgi:hypothetical protein